MEYSPLVFSHVAHITLLLVEMQDHFSVVSIADVANGQTA